MNEVKTLDISAIRESIQSSPNVYESVLVMVEYNRVRFSVAGEWFDTLEAALDHLHFTKSERLDLKIAELEAEKAKLEGGK